MTLAMRFLAALALSLSIPAVSGQVHADPGTTFSGWHSANHRFRHYHGYVPSSYRPGVATPLVVAIHGCTLNGYSYDELARWSELAEQRGFIVVFPDQNLLNNLMLCWNWQLAKNQHRGKGEPAIIAGITERVRSKYTVDPRRIYVTGVSSGGVMANIMAVAYPDIFAAASILAGCEYLCDPKTAMTPQESGQAALAEMAIRARAVPIMIWQGTADRTVPASTADRIVGQWATIDAIDDFADTMEYGQIPDGRSYTHQTYQDAAGNTLIERYTIDGAGHVYPGGCACNFYGDPTGPDATGLIWEFFEAHPMP